jgi:hypothetical protein
LSSIWKIWKCDLHWKEFSDGGDNDDDDDDDEEEGDWIGMHGTRWHRQIDILIYITIVYSIYILYHIVNSCDVVSSLDAINRFAHG